MTSVSLKNISQHISWTKVQHSAKMYRTNASCIKKSSFLFNLRQLPDLSISLRPNKFKGNTFRCMLQKRMTTLDTVRLCNYWHRWRCSPMISEFWNLILNAPSIALTGRLLRGWLWTLWKRDCTDDYISHYATSIIAKEEKKIQMQTQGKQAR